MTRSKRHSTLASIAGVVIVAIALPLASVIGCNEATSHEAPDANPAPCNTGPFIFCQPVPPTTPGCNTDEGAALLLRKVPKGTRYPVNCVINGVGSRDEQGDCNLAAVCKCIVAESPPINLDAGDVPPPPAAPAWSCDPP